MSNGGIKTTSGSRDVTVAECVSSRSHVPIECGSNGVKSSLATTSVNRNVANFHRRPTLLSTPQPTDGHVMQNDVTPTDNGQAVGCFACIGRRQVNSKTRHKAMTVGEANNTRPIDNGCRHQQNGRPVSNGDVSSSRPSNSAPSSDAVVPSDSNGNNNFKYCNILSADETVTVTAAEVSSSASRRNHDDAPRSERTSGTNSVTAVSRSGDVNNSSFEATDGGVVKTICQRTASSSLNDNHSTMNSVVKSTSRDGILRTSLVGDVNGHYGNHYVVDSCPQQVSHSFLQTSPSSCSHGTVPLTVAVPTSVCRRRMPTSSTCSDNLNRLYDCGRLSPEMTDSRNSTATLRGRYSDVRLEDEHRLISRYVERLTSVNCKQADCLCLSGKQYQDSRQQLVTDLEAKNRAILQEIHRLRLQQQQTGGASPCLLEQASYQQVSSSDSHLAPRSGGGGGGQAAPCLRYSLVDELFHLRRRRDELEYRMVSLQSSRLELVSQLQELMSVLRSRSTTPSTSPRSPLPVIDVGGPTLHVVSGDVQQAFASSSYRQESPLSSPISYRHVGVSRDLLDATDYITDAVTSLVKELNSDDSVDSAEEMPNAQTNANNGASTNGQLNCVDFLTELRQHRLFRSADHKALIVGDSQLPTTQQQLDAMYDRHRRHPSVPPSNRSSGGEVSDSCVETDQESFIRTDDEETGNTDWEETRMRWINR